MIPPLPPARRDSAGDDKSSSHKEDDNVKSAPQLPAARSTKASTPPKLPPSRTETEADDRATAKSAKKDATATPPKLPPPRSEDIADGNDDEEASASRPKLPQSRDAVTNADFEKSNSSVVTKKKTTATTTKKTKTKKKKKKSQTASIDESERKTHTFDELKAMKRSKTYPGHIEKKSLSCTFTTRSLRPMSECPKTSTSFLIGRASAVRKTGL